MLEWLAETLAVLDNAGSKNPIVTRGSTVVSDVGL